MMRRCGLLLMALVLGMGWPAPADAQTSRPEIVEIRFRGNEVFDDDALRGAIVNRQTECRNAILFLLCAAGVDAALDRRFLDPAELPLDALRLQAYYWLRGYRDALVDTARTEENGAVGLTFTIQEGEPVLVSELRISGVDEVDAEGILDDLPLAVGDPMSSIRIEAVRDTIVSRLREVGFAHADVFSGFLIPAGSREATVDFNVDPGPQARFGAVTVEWLPGPDSAGPQLDETTIRRMVPFQEGGVYRFSQLVEGQRNLYSLDIIRSARVTEERDTLSLDTIIPVHVRISEGNVHRVRTGLGWSTADCLSTEARWASRNFAGGARRLSVRARVSNILAEDLNETICTQAGEDEFAQLNGQASVELVQPFVFSPRNSLTTNAFIERQSLPDVFVREAVGFTLALTRIIGRQATTTLSWQPALARLEAGEVFFCISFLLCTERDIEIFGSANWLSPVGLNLSLNRSNRVLNPTAGYSLGVDLEHASTLTGSDFAYNRVVGEVAGYLGLGGDRVLAARVRGGTVAPGAFDKLQRTGSQVPPDLVHPQKRFYAGGASSVRGFAESRLGPRVLTVDVERLLEPPPGEEAPLCTPGSVADGSCDAQGIAEQNLLFRPTGGNQLLEANLELRFPLLGSDFQGAAFVDAGQVWAQDDGVDLGQLEVTPGLGVRYFSPIGPVRVDVGYRFAGAEFLPILTQALAPCDVEARDCLAPGGEEIPWAATADLQLLDSPVRFGGGDSFFRRLQLHFSIGQAF